MLARIETKVWAGLAGVLGGIGVLTPTALWFLGAFAFHGATAASAADQTIAAVPWPIALAVTTLLGGGGALTAGYKAPASNHAGNVATGVPMDDADAGHLDSHVGGHIVATPFVPPFVPADLTAPATIEGDA